MSELDKHERRISNLETDVSALKLDVSKISYQLDSQAERAEERHGILSTQQIRMMDLLELRDRENKEYRERREQQEKEAAAAHAQWVRSLVNPQTIVIILAILLSLMGTRVADVQEMAAMVGTPLPVPTPAKVPAVARPIVITPTEGE
tara:strand:+ start:174 stop:617 length:444 start_codon:yes stop_codon:yes gene_type:complete